MCAYYEDGKERIKKGDKALYLDRPVSICMAKHIKETRMMRIEYMAKEKSICLEVPYSTVMRGMSLLSREEKRAKINEMGQEVVEGFACKPKDFDANRPIMHFKYQIYICDDERCSKAAGEDRAIWLREILKDMGLNQGKNRIKISRSGCFGACRFRQVAQCVANTQANGKVEYNALWFRHTHQWDEKKWRDIFGALRDDSPLEKYLDEADHIPMKVYGEQG